MVEGRRGESEKASGRERATERVCDRERDWQGGRAGCAGPVRSRWGSRAFFLVRDTWYQDAAMVFLAEILELALLIQ